MTEHVTLDQVAAARAQVLPVDVAQHVENHVSVCPDCARLAEQLDDVTELLATLPGESIPQAVSEAVKRAIDAEAVRREQDSAKAAREQLRRAAMKIPSRAADLASKTDPSHSTQITANDN